MTRATPTSRTAALTAALIVALAPWCGAAAEDAAPPPPRSVGALEFGPDDTLFVADSEGAAVYAVATGLPAATSDGEFERIDDLDARIAALLGVGPREVFIRDMVTHRPSGTVVMSIMRGAGDDARPVLMTASRGGELAELSLAGRPFSRLSLADAPDAEAELYNRKSRSLTITDLEYLDGELFIAGLSNEEFASKLRRAPFPFTGELETTGLEIYHGAHGEWETFAPIFTFMEHELGGKPHVIASYLCTPLVTFPLDEIRSKSQLRGRTIAELGWGNVPFDILAFEQGGERWVLLANTRRGAMKMRLADIEAANVGEGITTAVPDEQLVAGVPYLSSPLGHLVQIDHYDADNVVMLWRSPENGALGLATRGKQWL